MKKEGDKKNGRRENKEAEKREKKREDLRSNLLIVTITLNSFHLHVHVGCKTYQHWEGCLERTGSSVKENDNYYKPLSHG